MNDALRRSSNVSASVGPRKGSEQDVCDEWWNTFRS
jgi:hypothetical protein